MIARGTNFTKIRVDLLRASKCDFSEAAFLGAEGMLATFTDSKFDGASFVDADIQMSSFDACAFEGARFTRAKLPSTRFGTCTGRAMSLEDAELERHEASRRTQAKSESRSLPPLKAIPMNTFVESFRR